MSWLLLIVMIIFSPRLSCSSTSSLIWRWVIADSNPDPWSCSCTVAPISGAPVLLTASSAAVRDSADMVRGTRSLETVASSCKQNIYICIPLKYIKIF